MPKSVPPDPPADNLDEKGARIETGGGLLAIRRPWPAMTLGIWRDPDRFVRTY
jgi:acetyl-CoA synthetase